MKRQRAERGGRRAETIAAWWLRLKGWAILARRARTPVGEVDLIEVKARASEAEAALALDDYRLRRVAAAAEALAHRYARAGDSLRIDAIFITPGRLPRHLADVWRG